MLYLVTPDKYPVSTQYPSAEYIYLDRAFKGFWTSYRPCTVGCKVYFQCRAPLSDKGQSIETLNVAQGFLYYLSIEWNPRLGDLAHETQTMQWHKFMCTDSNDIILHVCNSIDLLPRRWLLHLNIYA